MLKKMRWRFVWLAMGAFSAVILALLLTVNLWNYHITISQLDSTVSVLESVQKDDINPPDVQVFANPGFSTEVQYMIRFFTVSYDKNGNLTDINQDYIASVSENDAKQYANSALENKCDSGFYNRYRYKIIKSDNGTLVIFLNAERELQWLHSLLLITAVIALCSLLAVFLLAFIFSKRAVEPFVRNINAQKSFITNASHELKTPLTAISTSADVLTMEYPEDEWVENIRTQSAKMSVLISNLVTLTRLDEEHPESERIEFSLSDTAWEVSEPFASRARAVGKQLIQKIEENVFICGNQNAIQQLLSVLLDNALKYSDEDSVIKLQVLHAGKNPMLLVSNTCSSASELDTTKIFDRFYRGDSSHNGNISGNGIGLSIAKAAAETNGGKLSVKVVGDEITFKVLF